MSTPDVIEPWPRRYRVEHRTEYTYGMTVSDAYSVACLLPRTRPTQRILDSALAVTPEPNEYDERRDVFGNHVTQVGVHRPHDAFSIVSTSTVEIDRPVRPTSTLSWEEVALLAARESVERLGVLADHEMCPDRGRFAGGAEGGAQRSEELVAHAADVDDHARASAFGELAAQVVVHGAMGP